MVGLPRVETGGDRILQRLHPRPLLHGILRDDDETLFRALYHKGVQRIEVDVVPLVPRLVVLILTYGDRLEVQFAVHLELGRVLVLLRAVEEEVVEQPELVRLQPVPRPAQQRALLDEDAARLHELLLADPFERARNVQHLLQRVHLPRPLVDVCSRVLKEGPDVQDVQNEVFDA
jgi:hypothetical protein